MIKFSRLSLISLIFVLFFSFNDVKAQDWELLWSYDVQSLAGYNQFGTETDGTYLYTTFLDENGFAKYDFDGNWIETFSIPGAMYIHDLAYDGTYFYGSTDNWNNPICIIDFATQTLIGTIPVTLDIGINHIAYDSDNDGFWVGDWYSNLFLVGRDGITISTIPQSSFNVESVAGSAYDNVSEGGPYLWLHSQYYSGSQCAIIQINIETGMQTGIWHDAMSDAGLGMDYGYAGGLFNSTDMVPGTFVIGGLIQGSPYKVYAYSMLPYGNPPPILTMPENGSYGIDDLPLFQWEAVDYAVSYQIQVSTLSNFSITDIDVEGIETTQHQAVVSLEPLNKYYWRVRALDIEGVYGAWSRKFSFFIEGELPQPTLLAPGDGTENLMPNDEFSWEGNAAALNYYLQISSTADFSSLIVDNPTLTRTRYIAGGFEMNTQYWWRVSMTNPANTGDWSEAWTFTTGSYFQVGTGTNYNYQWDYPTGYGNAAGGAKQQFLIRPEEIIEAGGSPGFLMALGFNVAQINSGLALQSYEIKLKSVSITELGEDWDMEDFTSVYYNDAYVPTLGWNMHEFSTPYFWDGVSSLLVDVCFNNMEYAQNESCYMTNYPYYASRFYQSDYNETICSEYPQWTNLTSNRPNMQFQLEIPPVFPPFLESPLHKSVCASTIPLFEWTDSEGATNYTLQVAEDIDFNSPVFETSTTTSSYQVTEANSLNEVSQYFWRVNATDGENISFWSRTWGFVTEGDLPAPVLISPETGGYELDPVQTFYWESLLGATSYQLQIATDAEFNNITHDVIVPETQIMIPSLPLGSELFWRVKGQNECSEGVFSDAWTFTTSNIPFAYGYNIWWTGDLRPGPMMFSLANPENMFQIQNQQDDEYLVAGTWANDMWYGVGSWNYSFVSLDPATGDRTYIGNVGLQVTGITYDVQSETMYAICYDSGNYSLYTLDMATGTPTLVGPIGNQLFSNLAASVDGDLYSVCTTDDGFYYIDKFTGEPTLIGPTGVSADYTQDMEFEKVTNTCYWAGYIDYNGTLLTVDIETGAATTVGNFPNNLELYALAIPFIPACLEFPVLTEPVNASVCIETTPVFDWNDVEGALTYTFQIANDRSFTDIVLSAEELAASTFTVPEGSPLTELTRYFWRVIAYGEDNCNSYWSSKWSFVIEGDLPPATLLNPPNEVTNYFTSANFIWDGSIGAESYYLQVATNADFSDIVFDQPGITDTEYMLLGLNMSTQYWWRVRMISTCSESNWSEVWTFTTGAFINIGIGTDFNDQYTYPAPYGNWYGGCKHQILLRAEELYEAGALPGMLTSLGFEVAQINVGTVLQDFYISMKYTEATEINDVWDLEEWTLVYGPEDYQPIDGWNSHLFTEGFFWDGASNILLDICFNNLNYTYNESMYYTQTEYNSVRWCNRDNYPELCTNPDWANISPNRPNMMFGMEISGLLPPNLTAPENNAYCVSTTPLLDWEPSEGATSYNVVVALDKRFEFIVLDVPNILTTEYQVPAGSTLEENTQYYWRANASNETETSFWSRRSGFVTNGDLPTPTLFNPPNEITNYVTTVNFSWEGFLAATNYRIQIATDDEFENIVYEQVDLTTTNLLYTGLELTTQYYWRVKMISPCDEGDWSDIWTFTTGAFIQIGTGTNIIGQWDFPAPYGNNSPSAKHQFLIRASELSDAGMYPGLFTSLSFEVINLNSGATLQDYTISLKHTTENEIGETWDLSDWTQVYGPVDYSPFLGWNSHIFDNIFIWDGESNILVDICFNDYPENMSTYNEGTTFSITDFNSSRYYTGWGYQYTCTAPEYTSWTNARPNMLFGVDISGILPPLLASPANNTYGVPTTPLFEWNATEGATNYNIQVATDANFLNIVIDQAGLEATSYQVPAGSALLESNIYYWRVNGSDLEGNTSYWSRVWGFSTPGPLAPVTLFTPINLSTGVRVTPTFTWQPLIGAESYDIEIASDATFNNIVATQGSILNSSWSLPYSSPLENNTPYYWRVRGINYDNIGLWSNPFSFTTLIMVNVNSYLFTEETEDYVEFTDGTATNVSGDDVAANFDLPFTFYYAGAPYTQVRICTNGWVALGTNTNASLDNNLASTETVRFLTPLWDDLNVTSSTSITYKTEGEEPNRAFVVQFQNIKRLGSDMDNLNFQIRIYETTGIVTFNYGTMSSTSEYISASIGINGLVGGVMDFISITPDASGGPSSASSTISDNNIIASQLVSLPGKKFIFDPNITPLLETPYLVSPEDGSTNVSINPALACSSVPDAEQYVFQVSTEPTFGNIVLEETSDNTWYDVVTDLENEIQYWWRVKAINSLPNHSNWSAPWSFTTEQAIPWEVVITDNNSSVVVPFNINPMIGERPFGISDAIGLFFLNDDNEWQCAGFGVWDGQNLGIIVYGDNLNTPEKDGYSINETYTIKVWDGVLRTEWNATATYQVGNDFYTIGGFSMLSGLFVQFTTEMNIGLAAGWNMISSYVIPENTDIEDIYSPVVNNLKIAKNGYAQMYAPAYNINTIENWNILDGYLVNMQQSGTLTINGYQIVPEATVIPLSEGWTLAPYLRNNPMYAPTAFASITDNLVIAKDNFGGVYVPLYGINTIGYLEPTYGYYINVNSESNLVYPSNSAQKGTTIESITPNPKHLVPSVGRTGNSASLILQIDAPNGIEVGVYNSNDILIGSGYVQNNVVAVCLWGDNSITDITDGALENEELTAKVFNPKSNTLSSLTLNSINEITSGTNSNALVYTENAVYFAKGVIVEKEQAKYSISVVPNPVTSSTTFEFNLPEEGNAEIQIYTSAGELVSSIANNHYSAGTHKISFDVANLANGVYNVVLSSNNQRTYTIMIVGK